MKNIIFILCIISISIGCVNTPNSGLTQNPSQTGYPNEDISKLTLATRATPEQTAIAAFAHQELLFALPVENTKVTVVIDNEVTDAGIKISSVDFDANRSQKETDIATIPIKYTPNIASVGDMTMEGNRMTLTNVPLGTTYFARIDGQPKVIKHLTAIPLKYYGTSGTSKITFEAGNEGTNVWVYKVASNGNEKTEEWIYDSVKIDSNDTFGTYTFTRNNGQGGLASKKAGQLQMKLPVHGGSACIPPNDSNDPCVTLTPDPKEPIVFIVQRQQNILGAASGRVKKLPSAEANLGGYLLNQIDPLNGIRKGMSKQFIFQPISENDVDYIVADSGFAVQTGLSLNMLNTGSGTEISEEHVASNTHEMALSVSQGIRMDGGFTKTTTFSPSEQVSGTNSGEYSVAMALDVGGGNSSTDFNFESSLFSISQQKRLKYELTNKIRTIKITNEFINAVKALPLPNQNQSIPDEAKFSGDDMQRAQAVKDFNGLTGAQTYLDFLNKWGTHYPTNVKYGGKIVCTKEVTRQEAKSKFTENKNWKFDLEASAKKEAKTRILTLTEKNESQGTGGINNSGSTDESDENTVSKTLQNTRFYYLGGEGSFNSFTVGTDAEPVEISFAPLYDILDNSQYFADLRQDVTTFNRKRTMLLAAIAAYYPFRFELFDPDWAKFSPRQYELKTLSFFLNENYWNNDSYEEAVYGTVDSKVKNTKTGSEIKKISNWNRSDAAGTRVLMKKYQQEKFPDNVNQLHYTVYPGITTDEDDLAFNINSHLMFYRTAASDWTMADLDKDVAFSDIAKKSDDYGIGAKIIGEEQVAGGVGAWEPTKKATSFRYEARLVPPYEYRPFPALYYRPHTWEDKNTKQKYKTDLTTSEEYVSLVPWPIQFPIEVNLFKLGKGFYLVGASNSDSTLKELSSGMIEYKQDINTKAITLEMVD